MENSMARATSNAMKSVGTRPKETEETGRSKIVEQTDRREDGNKLTGTIILPKRQHYLYTDLTLKSANPSEAASLSASSGWLRNFKHLYNFQRGAVGRGRECRISSSGSEAK